MKRKASKCDHSFKWRDWKVCCSFFVNTLFQKLIFVPMLFAKLDVSSTNFYSIKLCLHKRLNWFQKQKTQRTLQGKKWLISRPCCENEISKSEWWKCRTFLINRTHKWNDTEKFICSFTNSLWSLECFHSLCHILTHVTCPFDCHSHFQADSTRLWNGCHPKKRRKKQTRMPILWWLQGCVDGRSFL